MKTRLFVCSATFVTIALLVLLMMGLLQSKAAIAAGPTYVSGAIFADTTWSASQSPYVVTGAVTLFPGYTLIIEPDVEVRFAPGTSLTIRGTLVAEGSISNPIVFTSNDSVPTKGSWAGLNIANNQGGKASVKFADISYAGTGLSVECCWLGGPVKISDSVFSNNVIALGGYAGWAIQVDRCTFENNTSAVTSADKQISNSVFTNNDYGLNATERVSVSASTFISNQVALYGGRGSVNYSTIINNGIGVQSFFEGFSLSYNTIASNTVGVILGQYDSYSPPVNYNNIYGNIAYNMKSAGASNKDATNNWWGTTNTSAIDASIYDGRDDVALGLIIYQPILPLELTPSSASVTVGPTMPSTLLYTDTRGSLTTIFVPAGAVTDTTTLFYMVLMTPSVPSGVVYADHAFTLDAYHDGGPLSDFAFQQPVTVTVNYLETDVADIFEGMLTLDYWNGSTWRDVATTCTPTSSYVRNLAGNQLSVSICHLSQFAVFGPPLSQLFLPLVTRTP